jgi:hypothetical protein
MRNGFMPKNVLGPTLRCPDIFVNWCF